MVTKVRGAFHEFEGIAHVDANNPAESSVRVRIQSASLTTGNAQRDGHLRSADFFDVETYPEIRFVSTDVTRDGTDWTITGD
jgi:polyisoprenoid-binding protein YceI